MQGNFYNLNKQNNLINGAKLFKLKVNRDSRGFLMETLKATWQEVFSDELPFGQSYLSVTRPGFARDENLWHVHPTKQIDRFVVLKGIAIFALYDWRKGSPTYGQLDLFLMGDKKSDEEQYILVIPKNVLHAFCVIGDEPCYLLGQPTATYDPSEEGRIPFSQVKAKFADGEFFTWTAVREYFHSSEGKLLFKK